MDAGDVVGTVCVVLGVVLVVLHVYVTAQSLRPKKQEGDPAAFGAGVIEKLADKAPHLAGGFAFILLGAAFIGIVDVDTAFRTSDGATPTPSPSP